MVQGPRPQLWWKRHELVPEAADSSVDWPTTAATMKRLDVSERIWVTKTASKNCGIGTSLVSWNYQTNAMCPRCACAHETTKHIAQC